MRTWNVVGKYPIVDNDGNTTHTEIILASTTGGYATFTERVLGDHIGKNESELVALARDAYFKGEYSDRAMSESVQKIDELEAVVKVAKKFMEEAEVKFVSMQASHENLVRHLETAEAERNSRFKKVEDKFSILNGSVMEMLTEFYTRQERDGEEYGTPQEINHADNVGGSDNSTDNEDTETE